MFFPLKDMNPTERFPVVTILLIVINIIVFLYEMSLGNRMQSFVATFGATPYDIVRIVPFVSRSTDVNAGAAIVTMFTSMFIHGGIAHILGNMLYLWIFGNNIEDILGPGKFLVFYLLCGLAAIVAHAAATPNSTIPTVGASGAISGVLGAYLIVYPRARVLTLIFFFIFIRLIVVPAAFLLIVWFVFQAISAFATASVGGGGGVAWLAHVGGFLAGIVLLKLMWRPRPRFRQPHEAP